MSLMQALKDALGNVNVIAEDLGFLTDGVRRLLYDSGFPGMKVIQFAFDSREESDYLPHNYEKKIVWCIQERMIMIPFAAGIKF